MMGRPITLTVIALLGLIAGGCSRHKEAYYQQALCEQLGGEMEYRLPDRSRVDCLTDAYAIEVEFARKWAEGIGQSLYYAQETGRQPAIGIIVRDTRADCTTAPSPQETGPTASHQTLPNHRRLT